MTKQDHLLANLKQALTRLEEALSLPSDNPINQDATIQRFEFTFELSWKLLQTLLQDQNLSLWGVKHILKQAAQVGYIENLELWLSFLQARNLSAHTYNQNIANQVYQIAKSFPQALYKLIAKIQSE